MRQVSRINNNKRTAERTLFCHQNLDETAHDRLTCRLSVWQVCFLFYALHTYCFALLIAARRIFFEGSAPLSKSAHLPNGKVCGWRRTKEDLDLSAESSLFSGCVTM